MIEYDKFEKSIRRLVVQFENYKQLDADLPVLMKEAVAESVIQRFETCWDCLWKILKKYLEEDIGLAEVPNGPNPILRFANENNLLPSPIEEWLKYAKARVSTAHDYSGEKAQDALALMECFIKDAIALYQILSGESWK
jgi:nucleotidyltransferase substrate binding protein (TIGR01987 family)